MLGCFCFDAVKLVSVEVGPQEVINREMVNLRTKIFFSLEEYLCYVPVLHVTAIMP